MSTRSRLDWNAIAPAALCYCQTIEAIPLLLQLTQAHSSTTAFLLSLGTATGTATGSTQILDGDTEISSVSAFISLAFLLHSHKTNFLTSIHSLNHSHKNLTFHSNFIYFPFRVFFFKLFLSLVLITIQIKQFKFRLIFFY